MAGKRTAPPKPEVVEIDLRGKTGPDIASMVRAGELDRDYALTFVAERAARKLQKALDA